MNRNMNRIHHREQMAGMAAVDHHKGVAGLGHRKGHMGQHHMGRMEHHRMEVVVADHMAAQAHNLLANILCIVCITSKDSNF